MTDLLLVSVALAFFALAAAYVALCDRVIGPEPVDEEPASTAAPIDEAVPV
ncbi:MAG: hypothetical protein AB7L13_13035 [Acidimicrobiia bacterium]